MRSASPTGGQDLKRILVMNQFVPPDRSPTARLVGDLVAGLDGVEWEMVGVRRDYRAGRRVLVARVWQEWSDLRRMEREAMAREKPDAVLCLSSPPMVLEVAHRVAERFGVPLHHWVLDLYPDVAVALGVVPGLLGGWLERRMGRALRGCASIAAVDEAMAARLESRYGVKARVVRPWPEIPEGRRAFAGWPGVPSGARVWLYSGNLGRAHLGRELLEIQATLEARSLDWWLVFQGGGAVRERMAGLANSMGLKQCVFAGYAAEEELASSLHRATVRVATQVEATLGMLWPSKVATLSACAGPLLWVGPEPTGDSNPLRNREGVCAIRPGEKERAVDWLESLQARGFGEPDEDFFDDIRGLRVAGLADWRGVFLP